MRGIDKHRQYLRFEGPSFENLGVLEQLVAVEGSAPLKGEEAIFWLRAELVRLAPYY